jgi:hypothetical protein
LIICFVAGFYPSPAFYDDTLPCIQSHDVIGVGIHGFGVFRYERHGAFLSSGTWMDLGLHVGIFKEYFGGHEACYVTDAVVDFCKPPFIAQRYPRNFCNIEMLIADFLETLASLAEM